MLKTVLKKVKRSAASQTPRGSEIDRVSDLQRTLGTLLPCLLDKKQKEQALYQLTGKCLAWLNEEVERKFETYFIVKFQELGEVTWAKTPSSRTDKLKEAYLHTTRGAAELTRELLKTKKGSAKVVPFRKRVS